MGRHYRIRLEYDRDASCPTKDRDGCWTPYSFCNHHNNHRHSDHFLPPNVGLRRKLQVGLAFWLDYTEHGRCAWTIYSRQEHADGILLWEHPPKEMGARTYADRKEDAAGFLGDYTAWCNGDVAGYTIEYDEDVVDSCWGFYPGEARDRPYLHMIDTIAEHLEPADTWECEGDLAYAKEEWQDAIRAAVYRQLATRPPRPAIIPPDPLRRRRRPIRRVDISQWS